MTKFKNEKIVRCKDIKYIPADVNRLRLGIKRDFAMQICEEKIVKGHPFALTENNNKFTLWF